MPGKSPTIRDVARRANVSTATVSRALSAPHRVSDATRERVSAAVTSTGFTLNQTARSLRLQAARTIVIAFPNIGNPFYSTILDAVLHEASRRGYGVLVANRSTASLRRRAFFAALPGMAAGAVIPLLGGRMFGGSLDLLARHDLQVPVIANHKVGQAVCDPIDRRHQSLVPDYVWGDGSPAGVQQRAAEEMTATFRLARAATRLMMRKRFGRIIAITSVVGVTGNPGQGNYSASKAGMIGMIKSLAAEYAKRNVTANCIAPGFIKTPMTDALNDKQREAILTRVPAARLGTPEDIAAAAVYLSSNEAAYVTGQTIHVNGGMAMV